MVFVVCFGTQVTAPSREEVCVRDVVYGFCVTSKVGGGVGAFRWIHQAQSCH